MIDDILDQLKTDAHKSHEALRGALSKIRTGRANPDILDGIRVDYWGTPTPLSQVATVSVPEARMLMVKVWDKQNVRAVEKAILEADLGLNPQTDGEFMRIPLPALTEERRRDLSKIARRAGEDCKVAIRKHRHEAREMLEQVEADGGAGKDEVEKAKKKVDEIVQGATNHVDEMVAKKEKDIMEI
jgi:ribosome recycling factor